MFRKILCRFFGFHNWFTQSDSDLPQFAEARLMFCKSCGEVKSLPLPADFPRQLCSNSDCVNTPHPDGCVCAPDCSGHQPLSIYCKDGVVGKAYPKGGNHVS